MILPPLCSRMFVVACDHWLRIGDLDQVRWQDRVGHGQVWEIAHLLARINSAWKNSEKFWAEKNKNKEETSLKIPNEFKRKPINLIESNQAD